ncbi:hypothetical protein GCK72_000972 [Caenorhabditis remanei]|uniref:VOC domain-containing protein n=1 Tax=Caenorhabditis remanei TaxID=31234 RepID=A0A6A5HMN3_CAERE|nr:hypothetical protein GCK72_000972 [Caenorhabditis remanei]KAF1769158.1 hypothetical protein GCK72_000972 [Caenorhabditis remanei]
MDHSEILYLSAFIDCDSPGEKTSGQPQPEHGVHTVFVELPNSNIELLHPFGEKSSIQAFPNKNKDGGMHHICIEVRNIQEAVSAVKSKEFGLSERRQR